MEFCNECDKLITEPCEHIKEIIDEKQFKICKSCNLKKNIEKEFYGYKNKKGIIKYKFNCIDCSKNKANENNKKKGYNRDTFHCDDCDVTILLRNKASHLRSIAHRNKSKNEYERGFEDGSQKAYNELKPLIKKLVNKWRSLKLDE